MRKERNVTFLRNNLFILLELRDPPADLASLGYFTRYTLGKLGKTAELLDHGFRSAKSFGRSRNRNARSYRLPFGQVPQHIMQNTTVLNILDLNFGIDAALQGDVTGCAINISDAGRNV